MNIFVTRLDRRRLGRRRLLPLAARADRLSVDPSAALSPNGSQDIWVGAIRSLLVGWVQVPLIRATKIEIGESAVACHSFRLPAGGWRVQNESTHLADSKYGVDARDEHAVRQRSGSVRHQQVGKKADRVHPPL